MTRREWSQMILPDDRTVMAFIAHIQNDAARDALTALRETMPPEHVGAWGERDVAYEAGWNECHAQMRALIDAALEPKPKP